MKVGGLLIYRRTARHAAATGPSRGRTFLYLIKAWRVCARKRHHSNGPRAPPAPGAVSVQRPARSPPCKPLCIGLSPANHRHASAQPAASMSTRAAPGAGSAASPPPPRGLRPLFPRRGLRPLHPTKGFAPGPLPGLRPWTLPGAASPGPHRGRPLDPRPARSGKQRSGRRPAGITGPDSREGLTRADALRVGARVRRLALAPCACGVPPFAARRAAARARHTSDADHEHPPTARSEIPSASTPTTPSPANKHAEIQGPHPPATVGAHAPSPTSDARPHPGHQPRCETVPHGPHRRGGTGH
jgi:hypothetical protein